MYAIVHKDRVVITSEKWYVGRINSELRDLEISRVIYPSDEEKVPIILENDTRILRYSETYPPINRRIEAYDGPSYTFSDDTVIADYYLRPLDLEIAKGNLKDEITRSRYVKEIALISIPLSDLSATSDSFQAVTVSTDRETRAVIAAKAAAIGDTPVNWKFPEGWLMVTTNDLLKITKAIDAHVQNAFDWEYTKHNEIDVCSTLLEIDAITISPSQEVE